MCQVCNESLLAASQAAKDLAQAAVYLKGAQFQKEATILAKAAAELFTEVQEDNRTAGEETARAPVEETSTIPQKGFHTDIKTGEIYLDGICIGRLVALKRS